MNQLQLQVIDHLGEENRRATRRHVTATSLEESASASALAIGRHMVSNRQLGIRKATKRPNESRAYTLTRTASRGRRRVKRTIMNRPVQWMHLLLYTVSSRNRSVL